MREPMHIVMPIHSFEPGGVERVALNLGRVWQEGGDTVTVVLGRRDGAMAQEAPGLDYVVRKTSISTAGFETLWMIWCLWRYLRRNPGDVLFCPGNTYAIVVVAMKLLLGRRCPQVFIKISNDLARRDMPVLFRLGYRAWLRLQGRMLDRFVGMAEPMRKEIADATRVPAGRVSIIEDPSLTDGQFARLSAIAAVPRPAGRFIAIGRLAAQKNFALLIRAFARGAAPDSELVILGEGPERPALEQLAEKLGVSARIMLPGHCGDTAAWLEDSSAFVLSSDYEGVPAVVLEAIAAGLPVIATDCSVSMAGLLGDGRFGILVPVGDEAGLAEAFTRITTLPVPSDQARRMAGRFTIGCAAPHYRALFSGAMAERGNSPPARYAEA